jgi:hypothetical protein
MYKGYIDNFYIYLSAYPINLDHQDGMFRNLQLRVNPLVYVKSGEAGAAGSKQHTKVLRRSLIIWAVVLVSIDDTPLENSS